MKNKMFELAVASQSRLNRFTNKLMNRKAQSTVEWIMIIVLIVVVAFVAYHFLSANINNSIQYVGNTIGQNS